MLERNGVKRPTDMTTIAYKIWVAADELHLAKVPYKHKVYLEKLMSVGADYTYLYTQLSRWAKYHGVGNVYGERSKRLQNQVVKVQKRLTELDKKRADIAITLQSLRERLALQSQGE